MTINLDTEVVSTAFDAASRHCIYTIKRGDRQWTVEIPLDDLERHGANKMARRAHLGNVLQHAMMRPADGE